MDFAQQDFAELERAAHLWCGAFRGDQEDAVSLGNADPGPGRQGCICFKQDEPADIIGFAQELKSNGLAATRQQCRWSQAAVQQRRHADQ